MNDMKFISQGTYGCVFSSNTCKNKKNDTMCENQKYVSKIQIQSEIDKESIYGKSIQTIFQYNSYFAPILETYSIDVDTIERNELTKCKIIQIQKENKPINNPSKYVSSKIRFVGSISINEHIIKKMTMIKRRNILFEMHLHILKGLQKLITLDNAIIHNDLKYANILIDDVYGIPIIIDFGLSFTKDGFQEAIMNPETLKKIFFSTNYYPPWTIEYTILSYIANNIISNQTKHINIRIDKVEKYLQSISFVIQNFVKKNLILIENDEIKFTFINKMNDYVKSFRSKTLMEFIQDLFQSWESWDNYSIAIMFYEFIVKNFQKNEIEKDKYLKNYQKYLLYIIITPLSLRYSSTHSYKFITSIVNN